MKAILQRVKSASVTVDSKVVSQIGKGVLVFAAVGHGDTKLEADNLVSKILKLRMWDDGSGEKNSQWKKSVIDIEGEVLCVSQFTLFASTKKGSKPDFHKSASGDVARELYGYFYTKMQQSYQADRVHNGVFQAMMDVALVNDGPVTLEVNVEPPASQAALETAQP